MNKDHSFPWKAELWVEPRNLPISVEFLCFHGIFRNLVMAGDKGTHNINLVGSGGRTVYVRDFATKYMTVTRAVMGGVLENIELSLPEISPVYLADKCICQLQLLVTK